MNVICNFAFIGGKNFPGALFTILSNNTMKRSAEYVLKKVSIVLYVGAMAFNQ